MKSNGEAKSFSIIYFITMLINPALQSISGLGNVIKDENERK